MDTPTPRRRRAGENEVDHGKVVIPLDAKFTGEFDVFWIHGHSISRPRISRN